MPRPLPAAVPELIVRLGKPMHPLIISIACLGLLLWGAGCKGKWASSARPLTIESVRQMSPTNSPRIFFEQRGGEIFVLVVDKYGDAHVHQLIYQGMSKPQVLELLKQKQKELEAQ
jgi:hypothetical protein